MSGKKHKVFVYGTLRPDGEEPTHEIYDYTLYNYFDKFPYVVQEIIGIGEPVLGVVLEVDDKELKAMDKYESVHTGLFKRETTYAYNLSTGEEEDVFIYVAGNIHPSIIESGDWFNK